MKTVPSTAHHRKRVALTVFTLCLLLSSLLAFYTYDIITRSSGEIQWRYYGPTQQTWNIQVGPAVAVTSKEEVPSLNTIPNDLSVRQLPAKSQARRILTTMPSSAACNTTVTPPKLILLWTPFFDSWEYFPPLIFEKCPNCTNCKVTTDRSRLLDSDAVIFHCRDMTLLDVPHTRLPRQKWVFYCLESPAYSDFPGLDFMSNMFNWTMTYRDDSDVVVPYGKLDKVTSKMSWNKTALKHVWKKKTKSVIWMSSHCPTFGNRDLFVSHLAKYIDVDIYGSCGNLACARNSTHECLQKFAEKYKFFLAFENSICEDYVTEKFFRTLKYDIVPVVFGGANYEKYVPRGSYIDALSFQSPKHLAFFLSNAGSDFSVYSAYFRWREDFTVTLTTSKECDLCDHLHERSHTKSAYPDMREWWVHKGRCQTYEG